MPDVGQVLKAEITRLARKEVKRAADPLHTSIVGLKQRVSDLRKRVARLERDNQRLLAAESTRIQRGTSLEPDETEAMRVTAKGIKALRKKLGHSQKDLALLMGVSLQSVSLWERKAGSLKLRPKTQKALASVRGLGVREARTWLDTLERKKGAGNRSRRKQR